MSVELWFAVTPLDTDWSPGPTLTPGLTLAPRFTSAFAMPTFASTPTFGLTFTPVPPAAALPDSMLDDWLVAALWFIVEVEPMSVELWLALTLLDTDWSPLPTFTPGLMLAPALMSVLLMPTFASTPTFGFALMVCANAGLNAANTAAAAALSNRFFRFMRSPFQGDTGNAAGCVPACRGDNPHSSYYARESDCSRISSRSMRPSRSSSTSYIAEAPVEDSSMPMRSDGVSANGSAVALPAAIRSTNATRFMVSPLGTSRVSRRRNRAGTHYNSSSNEGKLR